ncbi:ATP-dependent RNA helicase DDX18 [Leptonychotes weddellii]|uniref:ATP-dependent RNA helicase DDX18 n=1 Tax=Leptonychotes weddellii TaxID=9713 RepID=A0A7F8RD75_LEPWE|nr:ATP-dependent RNA helicase DDX18 [Leptonychotes weddellii]
MSHLPMKLLRKKIEKRNLKLRQRNLKLQEASDVSLSETQNGHVSEETVGGGKVKKSLKQSVNVGSLEAQNGEIAKETVETVQVKKKKKKSTIVINGEAATQPPNSESKKKKKKKRKMVDAAGPGKYFSFFELQAFKQFSQFHLLSFITVFIQHARIPILISVPKNNLVAKRSRVGAGV